MFCWVELGQVELGQVVLGQVELGQVELCQVELCQVELCQVELGQVELRQVSFGQAYVEFYYKSLVQLGKFRLVRIKRKIVNDKIYMKNHTINENEDNVNKRKIFLFIFFSRHLDFD